ncbi:unnamed protein product, partial [Ectocarpus sp. 12 AP-2014]
GRHDLIKGKICTTCAAIFGKTRINKIGVEDGTIDIDMGVTRKGKTAACPCCGVVNVSPPPLTSMLLFRHGCIFSGMDGCIQNASAFQRSLNINATSRLVHPFPPQSFT